MLTVEVHAATPEHKPAEGTVVEGTVVLEGVVVGFGVVEAGVDVGFGVVAGWDVEEGATVVEEGGGDVDPCPILLRILSHLLFG